MYVAKPPKFDRIDGWHIYDTWTVEKEFPCINGLSCWFVICTVDEPSLEEYEITDGAMISAKERAEWIAKVLNNCGQEYG